MGGRLRGVWEYGSMGVWEYGSMGEWESGSMGVWEYGRVGEWECGSVGVWEWRTNIYTCINYQLINVGVGVLALCFTPYALSLKSRIFALIIEIHEQSVRH